jgi:hypothetical protein
VVMVISLLIVASTSAALLVQWLLS